MGVVELQGWLVKDKKLNGYRLGLTGRQTKRWFRVQSIDKGKFQAAREAPSSRVLCYYKHKSEKEPHGWLFLKDVTTIRVVTPTCFVLEHPTRSYVLHAADAGDQSRWVDELRALVDAAKAVSEPKQAPTVEALDDDDVYKYDSVYESGGRALDKLDSELDGILEGRDEAKPCEAPTYDRSQHRPEDRWSQSANFGDYEVDSKACRTETKEGNEEPPLGRQRADDVGLMETVRQRNCEDSTWDPTRSRPSTRDDSELRDRRRSREDFHGRRPPARHDDEPRDRRRSREEEFDGQRPSARVNGETSQRWRSREEELGRPAMRDVDEPRNRRRSREEDFDRRRAPARDTAEPREIRPPSGEKQGDAKAETRRSDDAKPLERQSSAYRADWRQSSAYREASDWKPRERQETSAEKDARWATRDSSVETTEAKGTVREHSAEQAGDERPWTREAPKETARQRAARERAEARMARRVDEEDKKKEPPRRVSHHQDNHVFSSDDEIDLASVAETRPREAPRRPRVIPAPAQDPPKPKAAPAITSKENAAPVAAAKIARRGAGGDELDIDFGRATKTNKPKPEVARRLEQGGRRPSRTQLSKAAAKVVDDEDSDSSGSELDLEAEKARLDRSIALDNARRDSFREAAIRKQQEQQQPKVKDDPLPSKAPARVVVNRKTTIAADDDFVTAEWDDDESDDGPRRARLPNKTRDVTGGITPDDNFLDDDWDDLF